MGSLGENLKHFRQEANLTLDDLAGKTKIQTKYLERLENEEFSKLPGPVYVQGFIKRWAAACSADSETLLLQFYRENKPFVTDIHDTKLTPVSSSKFVITLRHLVVVLGVIILSVLGIYFYQNQQEVVRAPQVEIVQPAEFNSAVEDETITIRGTSENVRAVTVADDPVEIADDGSFQYTYDLRAGLNTILIRAVSDDGENIETVRKVLKLGE